MKNAFGIAVLGPTASGKSDVAIQIAHTFHGEIISCDSRQIYRGMDIGTGKVIRDPHPKEYFFSENVRHHLIDIVSPKTEYNIAKFKKKAEKNIVEILKRNHLPILCGGTGFWAETLIEQRDISSIPPNPKLRKKLETYSANELFDQLSLLDSERAKHIDRYNSVRLIRSLEIAIHNQEFSIDSKTTSFSKRREKKAPRILWHIIILNPPKNILRNNIEIRLDQRLRQGLIEEVNYLHFKKHISWKRLDRFGLEYRWVSRYLKKELSYEAMRDSLFSDIRHYAKRQLTWLRRWEKQGGKLYWAETKKEALQLAKRFCQGKND